MRRQIILISLSSIFFMTALALGEEQVLLRDKADRVSYALGMNIGNRFKQQSIDVNIDVFLKGLKDELSGGKRLLSDEEYIETLTALSKEVAAKQAEAIKKLGDKNKQESEQFLAENKKKEGVKTLPSGLQYKVIKEGSGKSPKEKDTVTVNYQGTLVNGNEFDSSYRRGEPATFPVDGVIRGWTEALQLMKEGAKWQLFIPSDLAYGEKGAGGGLIGPNAMLIFDVELISIQGSAKK
jgi:FKBP-type peptidyl-prolyl cis-trans isomerase FklB